MAESILRLSAVQGRVGLSRSSIYAWIAKGEFPRPIALGNRAVGWLAADIDRWIEMQISKSRREGDS